MLLYLELSNSLLNLFNLSGQCNNLVIRVVLCVYYSMYVVYCLLSVMTLDNDANILSMKSHCIYRLANFFMHFLSDVLHQPSTRERRIVPAKIS